MIANERNKRPIISFGLGKTEMTITLGDTVTIWQNEVYNNDEFGLRYLGVKKNLYSFELTPIAAGVIEIQCSILNTAETIEIKSNIIKLTVIE
ncbi:hypothetical protein [Flavobacterium sedimenticola]|uniref:Uncharacterized protein n=1 Tax=Flavobacterium sedimenticola TaxID=3043286 RepID=A0ABT6XMX9_9FLAO|nr:hypothetical protein [Flavobacterium sedimenticola]MDI9256327.1 hypothetical protein [Flavobacterium sedimenticola]